MNADEADLPEEDELTDLLVSWDEALASGSKIEALGTPDAPTQMQPELKGELAYLEVVRQAFRRQTKEEERDESMARQRTKTPPGTDVGTADSSFYPAPAELGRFQIRRELGRGGFGVVFLAYDPQLQREVALKVPRPDALLTQSLRERFQREARAASALDHPNVVPVYEAGSAGPACFIVSAYCPGPTLADWLKQHPEPVPLAAAATLVAKLALAVHYAHQHGVMHRDLKPANILLSGGEQKGEQTPFPATRPVIAERTEEAPEKVPFAFSAPLATLVPKITDFGLAKFLDEAPVLSTGGLQTRTGAVLGTPSYMAPEQASGKKQNIGPAVDIYALGTILYELLVHRPPFQGETDLETLLLVRGEEPVSVTRLRPTVPRDLGTICHRCLQKEPYKRYASAQALALDLERYLAGQPILARPVSAWERLGRWCWRNPALATASGLAATALVAVIVVSILFASQQYRDAIDLRAARNDTLEQLHETQQAQRESQYQLYKAELAFARARRWSGRIGQRLDSWTTLAEAAKKAQELGLDQSHFLDLRNEAIACLALADVQLKKEWAGLPPGTEGAVAFDAELERYARADGHGNICVRSVADDEELARLPGPGQVVGYMRFSPTFDLLAVQYESGNVVVWDWEHANAVFRASFPGQCSRPTFSPDGRLLAVGQEDKTLTLYRVGTWKEVTKWVVGCKPASLSFHPDGTKLAIGSSHEERQVQVRDVPTGNLIRTLLHPTAAWGDPAWHPEGNLLAAACYDSNVYLWDLATGRKRAVLQGHQASTNEVAFSAGGDHLLSSSWDSTSRLWDLATGRQLLQLGGALSRFSRDGRWIASRNGTKLDLWEVTSGSEYRALHSTGRVGNHGYHDGGVSPDGHWLAAAGTRGVELWDLAAGKQKTFLRLGSTIAAVFHPKGRELFTSGSAGLYRWPLQVDSGSLRIGPPRQLAAGAWQRLALDWDGQILAVAGGGGGLILPLEKPRAEVRPIAHASAVFVAVSPDGRWVATGTYNGAGVKLWEARGGKFVKDLLPDKPVATVAFSPDGQWLVTGTEAEFALWEVGSWQLARRISREQGDANIGRMAFSPDGKMLALSVARDIVQLVEPATGGMFAKLQAPNSDLLGWLGFNQDGSQFVVVSLIGKDHHLLHVWDLRRIRAQLKEIGLDWDLPPYPTPKVEEAVKPLQVEVDLGELEPARHDLEKFRRAVEANPNSPTACNNLAWFYATAHAEFRDPAKALPLAEKAVHLQPRSRFFLHTLGTVYYRLGQWDKAVETLLRGVQANNNNATAFDLFFLAMSYQQLMQPDKAKECYQQAIRWWDGQAQLSPDETEQLEAFRTEAATLVDIVSP